MQRLLPPELQRGGELPPSSSHVTLPAPSPFECQSKKRYVVTRKEATKHEWGVEAARQHAAAQEAVSAASQYNPGFTYGYQPDDPWY